MKKIKKKKVALIGREVFSEYSSLYSMIWSEVRDLDSRSMDFNSSEWEWSKWSIRMQLSHMTSLIFRWMIVRWGEKLFPEDNHGIADVRGIAQADDRRMDQALYWDKSVIMSKLKQGIELVQKVLSSHSVESLKRECILRLEPGSAEAKLIMSAHSQGVTMGNGGTFWTLEATIRHIYFEEITHLYNIQRLKRVQRLPTEVDIPRVGYWTIPGWDVSEP